MKRLLQLSRIAGPKNNNYIIRIVYDNGGYRCCLKRLFRNWLFVLCNKVYYVLRDNTDCCVSILHEVLSDEEINEIIEHLEIVLVLFLLYTFYQNH